MKKKLLVLAAATLLLLSLWTGLRAAAAGPATARFLFKGNKGLAPQVCLYKIDQKTREMPGPGFLAFGYNKSHTIGGFDAGLAPGRHSFEIVFNDKGVSAKPRHIVAKRLTLDMQAGGEYMMESRDFEIVVWKSAKEGIARADFSVEDVPSYGAPAGPCAVIKYRSGKGSAVDPFVSRVDGMTTPGLGDIAGSCNYSLPVDFKYFSGPKGELELKVTPGAHQLEFLLLGARVFDGLVQVVNFNFAAGKTYTIALEETKTKGKTTFTIKFLED